MSEILGDRAYKAAKKQTMNKLSVLREVILDASKKASHSPQREQLKIKMSSSKREK